MGGLAIGLFSWQYRKTKRLQARVRELEAQQTAQHAPVAVQEEYEPAPLCTLDSKVGTTRISQRGNTMKTIETGGSSVRILISITWLWCIFLTYWALDTIEDAWKSER
jgi:hypothetical protein